MKYVDSVGENPQDDIENPETAYVTRSQSWIVNHSIIIMTADTRSTD